MSRVAVLVPLHLLLTCAIPACSKPQEARRPDARPKVRAGGLSAGDEELVQAMRAVLERCQVSKTGRVTACPDDEDRVFRRLERSLGIRTALTTYCHGLADTQPKARALAGAGLSRLAYYRSMLQARDPKLLDCMLDLLARVGGSVGGAPRAGAERPKIPAGGNAGGKPSSGAERPKIPAVRPLARAAAHLATALKEENRLLPLLKRTKLHAIKEAGYGALWANGRLRLLKPLSQVIGDTKTSTSVRVSAINGFGVGGRMLPR